MILALLHLMWNCLNLVLIWLWFPLSHPLTPTAKSSIWLERPVIWNPLGLMSVVFRDLVHFAKFSNHICQKGVSIYFLLPHICSCNCFVSLYFDLSSESVCLLSTVICSKANAFSKSTNLSMILSTFCFCSTF